MSKARVTRLAANQGLTKKQWRELEGVCRETPPVLNEQGVGPTLDDYVGTLRNRAAYYLANVETVLRGQGYYIEPSTYRIHKTPAV